MEEDLKNANEFKMKQPEACEEKMKFEMVNRTTNKKKHHPGRDRLYSSSEVITP